MKRVLLSFVFLIIFVFSANAFDLPTTIFGFGFHIDKYHMEEGDVVIDEGVIISPENEHFSGRVLVKDAHFSLDEKRFVKIGKLTTDNFALNGYPVSATLSLNEKGLFLRDVAFKYGVTSFSIDEVVLDNSWNVVSFTKAVVDTNINGVAVSGALSFQNNDFLITDGSVILKDKWGEFSFDNIIFRNGTFFEMDNVAFDGIIYGGFPASGSVNYKNGIWSFPHIKMNFESVGGPDIALSNVVYGDKGIEINNIHLLLNGYSFNGTLFVTENLTTFSGKLDIPGNGSVSVNDLQLTKDGVVNSVAIALDRISYEGYELRGSFFFSQKGFGINDVAVATTNGALFYGNSILFTPDMKIYSAEFGMQNINLKGFVLTGDIAFSEGKGIIFNGSCDMCLIGNGNVVKYRENPHSY